MVKRVTDNELSDSLIDELFNNTYLESHTEVLEDCYLSEIDNPTPEQKELALKESKMDYYKFIQSFVSQSDSQLLYINEADVGMVSALRMIRLEDKDWLLEAVETNPNFRNKGYAFELLEGVIEALKKRNCRRVLVNISNTNYKSIKLHEKIGFIRTENSARDLDGSVIKQHTQFEYSFVD